MKKFFEKNRRIVLYFIVFIIGFPIVILCPSSIGIIPQDIGIAIVGYGGAIIGGFLTLYGVWWTIEDNNENRKKELELQYCPILTADIVEKTTPIYQLCSEIIMLFQHTYFDDSDLQYTDYLIKISNVGRGEIQNTRIEIKDCSILAANPSCLYGEINLEHSYILCDGVFQFIPVNGIFYLYIGFPKLKKQYYNVIKENMYIRIDVSLNIIIDGMFSLKSQEYLLHFFVDIKLENGIEKYSLDSMTFMKMRS